MTAPLPALEKGDEPTILIAATYAKTLDCKFSMNGEPSKTEIGIWQVVLVTTLYVAPLQSASEVK